MAHDPYALMISLSVDGLLSEEEQDGLYQHLRTCAACADLWARTNLLDRLFSMQPELAPPSDFTARVMHRIEAYEAHRHLMPWLVGLLALFSVLAGLSLALPAMLLLPGFAQVAAQWPVVGSAVVAAANGFSVLVDTATAVSHALLEWLTFLTTDPITLAVVIGALVIASTYIGLRESMRAMRSSEAYQQQGA